MTTIIYNEVPIKLKVQKGPNTEYGVRLFLIAPRKDYDLTRICEDIDILDTFSQAVQRYNVHNSRKMDEGKISDIKVRSDSISFKLQIKSGHMKSMRNTIGNSISKWLYTDYYWKKLTAPWNTELRKKLFTIECFEVS